MPSHDGVPLLEARGLQRSFGRVRVLRGIDLSLRPGEALAVVGPNGAGKTTLLRLLAGLMRPTAGEVRVIGEPLTRGADRIRRAIGLVSHQSSCTTTSRFSRTWPSPPGSTASTGRGR